MSQIHRIVAELKSVLRERNLTYAVIAERIGVSEGTVKRWFSHDDFAMDKFERVCEVAGIEVTELIGRLDDAKGRRTELTEAQEAELMSDPKLLLMAHLLVNRWTYDDILSVYKLSAQEAQRLLIRLDRMKVIELLPQNKVRLLVSRHIKWRPDGPIQRFFQETLMREFFAARFDAPLSEIRFFAGPVTEGTLAQIGRRIDQIAREFDEMAALETGIPVQQRIGSAVVLAVRPWHFSGFAQFKRSTTGGTR